VNGDAINNGAYDNASGIAFLIEIARAMATLNPRPKRSILFVAVCGEEKGLQGSDYFAHFPTVPIQNIVANVNLDMFLMLHPADRVVAFGSEHSEPGPAGRALPRMSLGMSLAPDPIRPRWSSCAATSFLFIRAGSPALFPRRPAVTRPPTAPRP
jgi:Zn-dependent M28 family amino/carboxypeptidase